MIHTPHDVLQLQRLLSRIDFYGYQFQSNSSYLSKNVKQYDYFFLHHFFSECPLVATIYEREMNLPKYIYLAK